MIAILALLIILLISIIVVRIGAVALELTGVSAEIASFQAQSAFSGAGFTTSEAETIVTHPLRRRIIRLLILLGSAGITTSIATLVASLLVHSEASIVERGLFLVAGLLTLILFARSRTIYALMRRIIKTLLERWTGTHVYDYEKLLGLSEGYNIARVSVRSCVWMHEKKLHELKLEQKGVLVLGIYRKEGRKEHFLGGPSGDTQIKHNDVLICYSRGDAAKLLSGECAHAA